MYSNPSSLYSTIGVVAFILVSEWFGGLSAGKLYLHTVHIITMCLVFCASLTKILMSIELRLHSVALTDTVQGAIMHSAKGYSYIVSIARIKFSNVQIVWMSI